jgi:cytidine deaminase
LIEMKEEIRIVIDKLRLEELSESDKMLVTRAREISQTAYAPYSKFNVGAALLLDNNQVVTGSNQENIAFPSGLCAERVALFTSGSQFPNNKVLTLAIVAKGELLKPGTALSPCGGCRQVMSETEMRQKQPFRVVLADDNDDVTIFYAASDLLPLTFGK